MTVGPSFILEQSKLPEVVWDGLGLFNAHSGVGHYGASLYRNLQRLGLLPKITVMADNVPEFVPTEQTIVVPPGLFGRRVQGLKPISPVYSYRTAASRHQKLIYHGLSNINLPCFGRLRPQDKFIITIHDIIPLLAEKNTALALQMTWLIPRVLERADQVITGSLWAKKSILDVFGDKFASKIIALGYGTSITVKKNSPEFRFDCFTIARGEAYKRLHLVSDIARNCPDKRFAVVTDKAGKALLGPIPENIALYSGLDDDGVATLLTSSRVLLHPSLYEGWCLPAADALQAGLFVIYCSGSGIDEVCAHAPGKTIALQPQQNAGDWSETLKDVLSRPSPDNLTINLPTWEEVAQKTLKLYQSLV